MKQFRRMCWMECWYIETYLDCTQFIQTKKNQIYINNKIKKELKIPEFKNESEEREYWSALDLSKHFEKKDFTKVSFPNLKPTTKSISTKYI